MIEIKWNYIDAKMPPNVLGKFRDVTESVIINKKITDSVISCPTATVRSVNRLKNVSLLKFTTLKL